MGTKATASRWQLAHYQHDPSSLAVALLGHRLVRVLPDGTRLAGLIVETEAYLGVPDRAAHSFGGRRTARTEPMFARAGTAYVYFTYGMHHCMNVVAGEEGDPVAVLIRALEPTEGLAEMARRRTRNPGRPPCETDLCSGPGKLCQAMGIDRDLSGEKMPLSDRLFVERARRGRLADKDLINTPRIGIDSAGDWVPKPLRWGIRASAHLSVAPRSRARQEPDRPSDA